MFQFRNLVHSACTADMFLLKTAFMHPEREIFPVYWYKDCGTISASIPCRSRSLCGFYEAPNSIYPYLFGAAKGAGRKRKPGSNSLSPNATTPR